MLRSLTEGMASMYLVLQVRREEILSDTLRQVRPSTPCAPPALRQRSLCATALAQISSVRKQDFKKPLKVRFLGEEGIDEGGVQKEFFQVLLRQLFDPAYGALLSYWRRAAGVLPPDERAAACAATLRRHVHL